ncbi:MAG: DUF4105 domain-containing protein [Pseudomonadota bacterium]
MRWPLRLLALVVILFAALWLVPQPSHDRNWAADHARTSTTTPTIPIILSDVRDWSYAEDGTVTDESWITAEVDPRNLTRVWFVVEPFTTYEAVAHTMLAFEFTDGTALVASVEARREKGETYQPIRAALMPTFEYLVVWATERDMYANTVYWAKGELFMYPLDLSTEQAQAILGAMLDLTQSVADRPRWYHTFFSNCANVLACTVNDLTPGAVPRSLAWYLPGYADSYLYDLGYIPGDSFTAAEASANATEATKTALPGPPVAFPTRLRTALNDR